MGTSHHCGLQLQFRAFQAVFTAHEARVPPWAGTQAIHLLILEGRDQGLPGDVRPVPKGIGQTHSKPDCNGIWLSGHFVLQEGFAS